MTASRTRASLLPHLPALDGLRGLAVVGVVLFHAHMGEWLKGGYLGVDLFFVLSGYLITSLLIAERAASGTIDLRAFWIRRARRLFPAVLSLIPAIALYARFLARPEELTQIRGDAMATLGYVANWRAVLSEKSYWDLFLAPSPLEHTWSLAIEEQFYVGWPLLVALVFVVMKRGPRALATTSAALLALSIATSLALYDPHHVSRVYFGTDTRAAAILAGAILAVVLPPTRALSDRHVRVFDAIGIVAASGLAIAWSRLDGQSPLLYRGGLWATEFACLALIACAIAGPRSIVARALAIRPLTYMGAISYGVYLWHWPIDCALTAERTHLSPFPLNALRLALTLAIAILSYRFFEQPIRTRGLPFGRAIYVVPASFAIAVVLMFGATIVHPSPASAASFTIVRSETQWPSVFSVDVKTLPPPNELRPGTRRILVLGDSVSEKLGIAMRFRQEETNDFVAQRGVGDCSIMKALTLTHARGDLRADATHECASAWASDVEALKPDATFIVLGGGYFAGMTIDGKHENACGEGWQRAYRDRLTDLIDEIRPNAGAIIVAIVPYPGERWRSDGLLDQVDCFDRMLKESATSRNVETLDLMTFVCPTRACTLFSKGEPIRPDGLHPDGVGAEELARFSLRSINEAIARREERASRR